MASIRKNTGVRELFRIALSVLLLFAIFFRIGYLPVKCHGEAKSFSIVSEKGGDSVKATEESDAALPYGPLIVTTGTSFYRFSIAQHSPLREAPVASRLSARAPPC